MALYTVSTSGNLEFAVTGLGNPVSTFANEGIATSAIASSPISGNNPKIWTIGPANYFTSAGELIVVDVNLSTQSGLAASAISEYPISGILDNIPQMQVGLFRGFTRQSSGNLLITGTSTIFFIPGRFDSVGNLVISGTSAVNKMAPVQSDGNLVISGNIEYNKTLDYLTNGNLIFTTEWYDLSTTGGIADYAIASGPIAAGETSAIGQVHTTVISFYGNINSSGELVFTQPGQVTQELGNSGVLAGSPLSTQTIGGGTDTIAVGMTYEVIHNETTNGNLLLISSSSFGYTYTSAGNLITVTSDAYNSTLTRDTGGSLVLSGADSGQFLWVELSAGLLTITPYGGYTYPLSSTSPIAGAALADQTIGGGMDTTPIQTVPSAVLNRSTEGNLLTTGNTVYNKTLDFLSSGNLIIFGTTNEGQKYLVDSSGNIVISGTTTQSSLVQRQTSGNLLFIDMDGYNTVSLSDSSSIAGSPIADLPLAGGVDVYQGFTFNRIYGEQTEGNLVTTGTIVYNKTLDFLSNGNLSLITSDSFNHTFATPTLGNLDISGNTVTVRTLDFLSAGNLIVVEYNLSTQSGLAASAIGEFPIGGTMDNIPQIEVQFVHGSPAYESHGNLFISGTDLASLTIKDVSQGNLLISGTDDAHRSWIRTSTGELLLSGNITQSSLRKELSTGNIVLSGTDAVRVIHPQQSSGNLVLTGVDSDQIIIRDQSSGVLNISGNITQSSLRKEDTSGNLVVVDQAVNALYSGSIADLPIATGPLAGGEISATTQQVQVTFYSNNYTSSGNLVFVQPSGIVQELGNTSTIAGSAFAELPIAGGMDTQFVSSTFQDILNENSSGNIVISGTTGYGYTYTSAGQLLISGTDSYKSIANIRTSGNLVLTGYDSGNIYIEQDSAGNLLFTPVGWKSTDTISGTIAGSTLASTPIGGDEMEGNVAVVQVSYISGGNFYSGNVAYANTHGNLLLRGYNNNFFSEESAGNLIITGTSTFEFINHSDITSAGNLIVSGSTVDSSTHVVNTSGELLINSTSTTDRVFNEVSSGELLITGSDVYNVTENEDSAGNLIITGNSTVNHVSIYSETSSGSALTSGSDAVDVVFRRVSSGSLVETGYAVYAVTLNRVSSGNMLLSGNTVQSSTIQEDTSGNILISGTSTDEFVPAGSIRSSGELIISGTTTAEFIPYTPPVRRQNQGGSYVFASSWDILTPYFKDDRHILGYVPAETEQQRRRKISGSTTFTVIRGTPSLATAPSKFDFLRNLPKVDKTPAIPDNIRLQEDKLRKQIMLEDEMLLNGSLLDFEDPDDELNRELLR